MLVKSDEENGMPYVAKLLAIHPDHQAARIEVGAPLISPSAR